MIKVGLIVDEFFGGADTAFGGYGFLARKYIANYIANEHIRIEVLLGKGSKRFTAEEYDVDNVKVYRLPRNSWATKRWLKKKNYDVYLSIELTDNFVLNHELASSKKLVLWVQDPRPTYEWDEINTVKLFPEFNYYDQKIYDLVNKWYRNNRVKFISQGVFLNQKAIDLYELDQNTNIQYLPNPIDIDVEFNPETYVKKNIIIFLGRIESVKRGWLFCEIAKKMPNYQFYVLGKTHREASKNSEIMKDYYSIVNLHFVGHVEGKDKEQYLKDAKILVNTSIHEALPISFLEALSYGTLLVSNRNPENLTDKFGVYVGNVIGDGFDKVDLYVNAIDYLIGNDEYRKKLSFEAIQYIKHTHNVERFVKDLRQVLVEASN